MVTPTTARPDDGSHLPAVHMNGSGRKNLLTWLGDARYACQKAVDKLCEATPNGRDYPRPGSYEVAMAEHYRRINVLSDLIKDMEADELAICDMGRP